MLFSTEAFRINLVNRFGAGRSCSEPSTCGGNLDATNGIAISSGVRRNRYRLLPCQVSRANIVCSDVFESRLLLIGRSGFGPAIERFAERGGELAHRVRPDLSYRPQ